MEGLYPLKFTPIFKDKIWGGNNDFRFITDLQRNSFSSFSASVDCVSYTHEKLIAFCRKFLCMIIIISHLKRVWKNIKEVFSLTSIYVSKK